MTYDHESYCLIVDLFAENKKMSKNILAHLYKNSPKEIHQNLKWLWGISTLPKSIRNAYKEKKIGFRVAAFIAQSIYDWRSLKEICEGINRGEKITIEKVIEIARSQPDYSRNSPKVA